MRITLPDMKKQAHTVFKCQFCGYIAQVQGELYIDRGSHSVMQTKVCRHCNILFEDSYDVPITMTVLHPPNSLYLAELIDCLDLDGATIGCLRCGKPSREVWTKEYPVCPKCHKLMIRKFTVSDHILD